jgi:SAM-dependent methyltransferase
MDKAEFDKFADEYRALHSRNIRVSGESPEFFAEYKVIDTLEVVRKNGLKENIRIVDFGSGIGNAVPYFAKHFKAAELYCIDVSKRSLEISKERFPGIAKYKEFDGETLPFDSGSIDLVFTACVFHHIPEFQHERLLKEIHRVLSKSGLFIVFEHNPRNPLTVKTVDTCPFDENAILIDERVFKNRLKSAGFSDVRSKFRIFFPGLLRTFRYLERFMGWIPFGAQYYVSGKKSAS